MIIKLIYKDSKSNKYWNLQVIKLKTVISYGRVGSKSRESIVIHKNKETLDIFVDKQIKSKVDKGYEIIGSQKPKVKKYKAVKFKIKGFDKIVEILDIDYDVIKKGDVIVFDDYIKFKNNHDFIGVGGNKIQTKLTKEEIKNKKIFVLEEEEEKEYSITVKNGYGTLKKPEEWYGSIESSPSFDKIWEKLEEKKIKKFEESGIIVRAISDTEDLLKEIKAFEKKTTTDYHPFSNKMIRDVVHPSLYPYIQGVSKLKNKKSESNDQKIDFWNRPYEKSQFQWLPSEFIIEQGKTKIDSYINNLPETEISLYNCIERLFDSLIPDFEKMWGYIQKMKLYNVDDSVNEIVISKNHSVVTKPFNNLQVIVKIVTISVNDKLNGAWHVEGMSHENIVMTAVSVLEQNGVDAKLNFKRRFTEEEAEYLFSNLDQNRQTYVNNFIENGLIPLGQLSTQAGKAIIFPNSHVHKLDLIAKGKNIRRIVVFWVINPDKRIISTKDVDVQQKKINKTRANKYRLKLMKERKYNKQKFNVRDINLCEH